MVIAGTCTPFFFALNNTVICWVYVGVVWVTALLGTFVHLIYPVGLDWLFTIVYIVLGLAPITIIWLFWRSPYIGPIPTILVIAGVPSTSRVLCASPCASRTRSRNGSDTMSCSIWVPLAAMCAI